MFTQQFEAVFDVRLTRATVLSCTSMDGDIGSLKRHIATCVRIKSGVNLGADNFPKIFF